MSKRYGEHISMGDALNEFISNGKLEKGLNKVTAEEAWHQVLGEAISKYTTQVFLERQTLYVSLSSSVLREELSYGKDKIITLLNEACGKELITKLILK